jgi:selenocysteine-specific elongation factor
METRRKNIMLGTAGHVDHGKTAVVKLLTGCDTDSLAEEKQRGMTIDLGFAPCRLANDRIVGVVDVPGHVDFIRNMVAGAHGIDVVIFVVAADDGVMPQTREHLHILTLMGLRHGLIALTKVDLVPESRRSEVAADVRRLLAGTFLAPAPLCPLSALTGEGFEAFFDTLTQVVDGCGERPCAGAFHVWVEDVFTIRGAGTVVTGIPTRGRVHVGERLETAPGSLSGRVRQLQVYGEDASEGRAGECVALNLADVDHQQLRRGAVLATPDAVRPVEIVEADLELIEGTRAELQDNLEVHLHIGTATQLARVAMLERPRMQAGDRQAVQLRLAQPLGIVPGERFVVRTSLSHAEGGALTTVGGGRVLGVGNVRLRRYKSWTLAALAARRSALDDPTAWCRVMLEQAAAPLGLADLARVCVLPTDEARARAASLARAGDVLATADGRWIHAAHIRALADRLLAAIQQFHTDHPRREGIDAESLRSEAQTEHAAFDLALEMLKAHADIEVRGDAVAAAGWHAQLAPDDEEACERLATMLREAGWLALSPAELAARLTLPGPRLAGLLQVLVDRGTAVSLAGELYVHADAVHRAREVALRLFARAPTFSTMEFRDALGVSRKYAVPLLDHLDAIRFTARSGNQRTPGAEARKRL